MAMNRNQIGLPPGKGMKFILLADSHIGGKNDVGFQQQPKYPEQHEELLDALDRVVREERVDFILHAGDMTEHGTVEEIRLSRRLFSALPIPVYLAAGNHDCRTENSDELWLSNAPEFFPDGTIDTSFVRGGIRFELLCNSWSPDERRWVPERGMHTGLTKEQYARLNSGDQTLPRMVVMHSQIRPGYTRQTGMPQDFMPPENHFENVGSALIDAFHPLMILGGHNHLNLCERIGNTLAVTPSAFSEAPFEYKIVEVRDGWLSMKTARLGDMVGFPFRYLPECRFIQGDNCDREARCRIRPV